MGLRDGIAARLPRLNGAGRRLAGLAAALVRGRALIAEQDGHEQSLGRLVDEFTARPTPGFRNFIDSLNNLPGPVLVVSTTAMAGFALLDPAGFSARMNGLNAVPEPLWWLMGGLVSLYFGTREMRFVRGRAVVEAMAASLVPDTRAEGQPAPMPQAAADPATDEFADNAALRDWAALRG